METLPAMLSNSSSVTICRISLLHCTKGSTEFSIHRQIALPSRNYELLPTHFSKALFLSQNAHLPLPFVRESSRVKLTNEFLFQNSFPTLNSARCFSLCPGVQSENSFAGGDEGGNGGLWGGGGGGGGGSGDRWHHGNGPEDKDLKFWETFLSYLSRFSLQPILTLLLLHQSDRLLPLTQHALALLLGALACCHLALHCRPALARSPPPPSPAVLPSPNSDSTEDLPAPPEAPGSSQEASSTPPTPPPTPQGSKETPAPDSSSSSEDGSIWEVKGNRWRRYVALKNEKSLRLDAELRGDEAREASSSFSSSSSSSSSPPSLPPGPSSSSSSPTPLPPSRPGVAPWLAPAADRVQSLARRLFLPAGFPHSVTPDYAEYTAWKMSQVVISETMRVLTTQSLLYSVGLGRGAIPVAAALSWALKDGLGYTAKICLSQYGKHFDVNPKGWRIAADVAENAACGLELLTASFPAAFFPLASAAGAGLSAAGLIQAATKSCFYAGFAAQRNFAELIAKGEAQGMAGKSVGIAFGIFLSSRVGPTGPWLLLAYAGLASCHLYCNLRSYQAVQLRTLNPYRAGLVLGEYVRSGRVAGIREVNAEEPIFPNIPFLKLSKKLPNKGKKLTKRAKAAASSLRGWINLGVPLGAAVKTAGEAFVLQVLYKDEKYILACQDGKAQIVLKEGATARDQLRAIFQAIHLHYIQSEVAVIKGGVLQEVGKGGALRVSRDYVVKNFGKMCEDLESEGWIADGLVARPGNSRLVSMPQWQPMEPPKAINASKSS